MRAILDYFRGKVTTRSYQHGTDGDSRFNRKASTSTKAITLLDLTSGDASRVSSALDKIEMLDNAGLDRFFGANKDDNQAILAFRNLILRDSNEQALEIFLNHFAENKSDEFNIPDLTDLDKDSLLSDLQNYILNQEDEGLRLTYASAIASKLKAHTTAANEKVSVNQGKQRKDNNILHQLRNSGAAGKLIFDILNQNTSFVDDNIRLQNSRFSDNPDTSITHQSNSINLYNRVTQKLPGFKLSDFNLDIVNLDGTITEYNMDKLIKEMCTSDVDEAAENFIKAYMSLETKKNELLSNQSGDFAANKKAADAIAKKQTRVLEFLFSDNKLRSSEEGRLLSDQLLSYINSDKGLMQVFSSALKTIEADAAAELREFAVYFKEKFSTNLELVKSDGSLKPVYDMKDLESFLDQADSKKRSLVQDFHERLTAGAEAKFTDILTLEDFNEITRQFEVEIENLKAAEEQSFSRLATLKGLLEEAFQDGGTSIDTTKLGDFEVKQIIALGGVIDPFRNIAEFSPDSIKELETNYLNQIATVGRDLVEQFENEVLDPMKSDRHGYIFREMSIPANCKDARYLEEVYIKSRLQFIETGYQPERHVKEGQAKSFLDTLLSSSSKHSKAEKLIYTALIEDAETQDRNDNTSFSKGYVYELTSQQEDGYYDTHNTYIAANQLASKIKGNSTEAIKARKMIFQRMLGVEEGDLNDKGFLEHASKDNVISALNTSFDKVTGLIDQSQVIENARVNIVSASRERMVEGIVRFANHTFRQDIIDSDALRDNFAKIFENSMEYESTSNQDTRLKLLTENMRLLGFSPNDIDYLSLSADNFILNSDEYIANSSFKTMFNDFIEMVFDLLKQMQSKKGNAQ